MKLTNFTRAVVETLLKNFNNFLGAKKMMPITRNEKVFSCPPTRPKREKKIENTGRFGNKRENGNKMKPTNPNGDAYVVAQKQHLSQCHMLYGTRLWDMLAHK